MPQQLRDSNVAILVTRGFEQVELTEPRRALQDSGAVTHLIAPDQEKVRAWNRSDWGDEFDIDIPLQSAKPESYHALLLPGGVMSPDRLRMNEDAVAFVRSFFEAGKPVASICHGPWMVIEAGAARGRNMTSYPSLRTDLRNAGAEWMDQEVVVDQGLVTSRRPDDLPAFNRAMIEEFVRGLEQTRRAA